MNNSTTWFIASVVLALLVIQQAWMNTYQPQPYMDEWFHIPQAQFYCKHPDLSSILFQKGFLSNPDLFNKDITTLPTIYLLTAYAIRLWKRAANHIGLVMESDPCDSIKWYRAFNALIGFLLFWQHYETTAALIKRSPQNIRQDGRMAAKMALSLWLHPMTYFFQMFYYTDNTALLLLLRCMQYSTLLTNDSQRHHKSQIISSLFGIASALIRQNFAVWHGMVVVTGLVQPLQPWRAKKQPKNNIIVHILIHQWPHMIAAALYLAFFVWNNKELALGHVENHSISIHWMMLWYFAAYRLLFPNMISLQLISVTQAFKHYGLLITLLILAIVTIHKFTLIHPFVLADNRHYTFILYRHIILAFEGYGKFLLLPIYAIAMYVMWFDLSTDRYVAFSFLILGLVPVKLLEPRYFVPPFMICHYISLSNRWRQQEQQRHDEFQQNQVNKDLVKSFMVAAIQNALLLLIFFKLPFDRAVDAHMPQDISPGRWMP